MTLNQVQQVYTQNIAQTQLNPTANRSAEVNESRAEERGGDEPDVQVRLSAEAIQLSQRGSASRQVENGAPQRASGQPNDRDQASNAVPGNQPRIDLVL